jgi:NAD(P)H-hydrate epimerase
VFINTTGNSGLAVAGSGDVLSGMIVSRLAQGDTPLTAALASVYLHGKAADTAAKKIGEAALLPTDVIEELRKGGYML